MRPYLTDLRERVAAAVHQQEGSLREIAQLFRVSVSFVVRLLQLHGRSDPDPPQPARGNLPVRGPQVARR
jgi:transposase